MTDNRVLADLIGFIKSALANFPEWEVLQSFQPTRGNYRRPYVLLHRLTETFIGQLQRNSFAPEKGGQIIQTTWQIDAVRYAQITDGPETLTAGDVLKLIRNWFMSDTAAVALRAKGYNVLRVGEIITPPIDTENETWQILPNLTLDLIYKQTYEQHTPQVTSAQPTIKGV